MCGGVVTASQSMADSVSVVCQNLHYFFVYSVLVVIENCKIFSLFLAAKVEGGELQHSADVIRQAITNTDPELREGLNGGPPYPCIDMSASFDITWAEARIYIPVWSRCVH